MIKSDDVRDRDALAELLSDEADIMPKRDARAFRKFISSLNPVQRRLPFGARR
jgi:hypothetical protein